jgi:hypothetical protein
MCALRNMAEFSTLEDAACMKYTYSAIPLQCRQVKKNIAYHGPSLQPKMMMCSACVTCNCHAIPSSTTNLVGNVAQTTFWVIPH